MKPACLVHDPNHVVVRIPQRLPKPRRDVVEPARLCVEQPLPLIPVIAQPSLLAERAAAESAADLRRQGCRGQEKFSRARSARKP